MYSIQKSDTIHKTHSECSVADIHRIKLKAETFKVMEANIEMLLHAGSNSFFLYPSKACEKDIMTKITIYQIVHLSCTEMDRISREQHSLRHFDCFRHPRVYIRSSFSLLMLFHWNPPIIIGSTQFTKYYNLQTEWKMNDNE